jgi:CheY-like chemotaxis protein
LPVIVLSTSSNPIDLKYCYASGANAYHVKPVAYNLHLQVLQQIFTYWLNSVNLYA